MGTNTYEQEPWYLGEPMKKNQEGKKFVIFRLSKKGVSSPGNNDKRECSQKVGLKKWNLEALKKEGTITSLLGPPRIGKSTRGF